LNVGFGAENTNAEAGFGQNAANPITVNVRVRSFRIKRAFYPVERPRSQ
jgi:hypothetical protein